MLFVKKMTKMTVILLVSPVLFYMNMVSGLKLNGNPLYHPVPSISPYPYDIKATKGYNYHQQQVLPHYFLRPDERRIALFVVVLVLKTFLW